MASTNWQLETGGARPSAARCTSPHSRSVASTGCKVRPWAVGRALRSDVSKLQDLDTLLVDIKSQFGGLDMVFANAGVFIAAPLQ